MSHPYTGCRFLFFLSIAFGVMASGQEEKRYSELVRIIRFVAKRNNIPEANVAFSMKSKKEGVSTSDIRFLINSGRGTISISPDAKGLFSFPIRRDLLEEDPVVTTNQEPGSVAMTIELRPDSKDDGWRDWADRVRNGAVTRVRLFECVGKGLGKQIRSFADIENDKVVQELGSGSDGMLVYLVLDRALPFIRNNVLLVNDKKRIEIEPTTNEDGNRRYEIQVTKGNDKEFMESNPWIETPVVPWDRVAEDSRKGEEYAIIAQANAWLYGLYGQKREVAKGVERLRALADKGSQMARAALDQSVLRGVGEGNAGAVAKALAAGAKADTAGPEGTTALMLAARGGHGDAVKALLAGKADVNATRPDGATALMAAAEGGHGDIVQALLAAGANVRAARSNGATALMAAANGGHGDAVKVLLAAKANVDAARSNGATALMLAALEGHGGTVKALLAAGANVNAAGHDGATPLMLAAMAGDGGAVKALLVGGANVNAAGHEGATALMLAAEGGHGAVLKTLLAAAAKVNVARRNGITALMLAANGGHGETTVALLAAKADVNAVGPGGMTALMAAARGGHGDAVKALVAAKADVNATNQEGDTALALALRGRHQRVVDVLKAAGTKQP